MNTENPQLIIRLFVPWYWEQIDVTAFIADVARRIHHAGIPRPVRFSYSQESDDYAGQPIAEIVAAARTLAQEFAPQA